MILLFIKYYPLLRLTMVLAFCKGQSSENYWLNYEIILNFENTFHMTKKRTVISVISWSIMIVIFRGTSKKTTILRWYMFKKHSVPQCKQNKLQEGLQHPTRGATGVFNIAPITGGVYPCILCVHVCGFAHRPAGSEQAWPQADHGWMCVHVVRRKGRCLRLTLQRHESPVWRLKPSVYQSPSGGQQHTGVPTQQRLYVHVSVVV